ncbi:uncharacterized protein Tco025E_07654 [Trypanosoma conorhini]|uniref:Uncharacterized protein n=1 Tax=Trypanosoma conorhini TaxID=83891 RepID=A0A3R7RKS5_9TRYP|nr:uncharacterized protein Tco025E_07654 [Trypanosoma conorhini]RNF06133.1 hypothetical protein Tco025E_07654 [Trypanosoma conorhini]
MTFSERDAILNDEEEWVNIPTVLRSLLRQLNNEVQNNRITCDAFLDNQKEHDHLIKGILSKQLERELEMKKTELTLQQECHDVQASFSAVLGSIREQVRHLSEEQQQMRDCIRQIEDREHDAIAKHDGVSEELKVLPKTMNQRSMALERTVNNKFQEISGSLESLKAKVDMISERGGVGVAAVRKELEGSNVAWRQVGETIAEEMDSLRIQFHQYESNLRELKLFQRESEGENRKLLKAYTDLHEKVHANFGMVKQLETSSNYRFEAVFSALQKSQDLAEKLSRLHRKREEEEISAMAVVQKTQDMYSALTEDLKRTFDMQLTQHRTEFERFNRRISELHQSKEEVAGLVHEKNESVMVFIEELRRRIDSIESTIERPNLMADIEHIIQEGLAKERMGNERRYAEIHQFISEERSRQQSEIEEIRTTLELLDGKSEKAMTVVKSVEIMGENMETLGKQVNDYEEFLNCVRKDMNAVAMELKGLQEMSNAGVNTPNNDAPRTMTDQEPEVTKYVSELELFEMKSSVKQAEERLSLYAMRLNEMQQQFLRVEALVEEVPRTYERYREGLHKKLSPALLQLEMLQQRIASLELKFAAGEPREGVRHTSTTSPEGGELEATRLGVRLDQALQSAQRKIQETDVRLDGFQLFCNTLEGRVERLSREIAEVANKNVSFQEDEEQRRGAIQKELERVVTRMREMEANVQFCEESVASGQRSLRDVTSEIKESRDSFERVSDLIVTLERSVRSCITADSKEWRSVYELTSMLSRCKLDQQLTKLREEFDALAPLEQVRFAEEALSEMRREKQAFKQYADEVKVFVSQKLQVENLQEGCDDVSQPRCALEQRVTLLEESARENSTHMASNLHDVILPFDSRVSSLEAAVAELRAQASSAAQPQPCSSSLAVASEVAGQLAALGDRLTSLEGAVLAMQEKGGDDAAGVKGSELRGRLPSLECSVVTCKRGMEESFELVTDSQRRMDEGAERHTEHDFLGISDHVRKFVRDELEASEKRVRCLLNSRFESFWKSYLPSTARKVDRERLAEEVGLLWKHVESQLNALKRELQVCH